MTTTGQTHTPSNNQNTGLILVVGDVQDWLSNGRELPKVELIEFVKFNEITADLLQRLNPCVVLAPSSRGALTRWILRRSFANSASKGSFVFFAQHCQHQR
ncbi:hypothetical protein ACFFUT_11130 [Pseudohalocynthiibacter aestuariivivens]|uniref:Uncharacterized protein n=1 Tax=Pseudohalocynthiibacter aestuariivivens TaxID=1591409 RepID=A0ABV5JHL3_9RHOB|nr:hypothetical protein [Pseudohalocynthiibacter aestuariivivens]MBS9716334.1 hypothetical protein [Pseudohalocynthiibacter aestuariivivens]